MAKKQTYGSQFLERLEEVENVKKQMLTRKESASEKIIELEEEVKRINAEILGALDSKEEAKLKKQKSEAKAEIEELSEYLNLSDQDLQKIIIKKLKDEELLGLKEKAKEEYLEAKKPYDEAVDEAEKTLENAREKLRNYKNMSDYPHAKHEYSTLMSGGRTYRKFNL